jgi:hypothetical protein
MMPAEKKVFFFEFFPIVASSLFCITSIYDKKQVPVHAGETPKRLKKYKETEYLCQAILGSTTFGLELKIKIDLRLDDGADISQRFYF